MGGGTIATLAIHSRDRLGRARLRFTATIFVGSFLLFLVQPMIARMALPRLGGAPAVWNSAMLVYQALLLAGYAYAHLLGRFRPQQQAAIHVLVLIVAATTLPIGLTQMLPPADANPFVWVPWLLIVSIGPLFLVVAAQAPLIQRWYSLSLGDDPYPLYAASNLGSFAGLLAYPLLVEPLLPLAQQRGLWSAGYLVLVLLVCLCAMRLPGNRAVSAKPLPAGPAPGWRSVGMWILLSAVPSGLILSTTLHLTTDVVAMPLLWVVPLGAYLLSFTIAFAASRAVAAVVTRVAPFVLLISICLLVAGSSGLNLLFAGVAVVNLFTVSVALHSELFDRRPGPERLTLFYLAMSVGGFIGGLFCGLAAPLIFDWTYEHLLLLVAAASLMFAANPFERFVKLWDGSRTAKRVAALALAALAALVATRHGLLGPTSSHMASIALLSMLAIAIFAVGNRFLFAASAGALVLTAVAWDRIGLSLTPGRMTRSYFGVYSIDQTKDHVRTLVHGTTLHGAQNLGSAELERLPTTYYGALSGVGLALRGAPSLFPKHARIDVVGLGTGTVACYARPGQSWTFYEIDPAVAAIATDPHRFTFLSRCLPKTRIEIGDARLSLARSPAAAADLIVVDAFSSDSIPVHLLTREAFAVYRRRLAPRGLLLVHISNRHLDLEPVIAGAAAAGGWHGAVRVFRPGSREIARNQTTSVWVALSPSAETLHQLVATSGEDWRPLSRSRATVWSDDHASLLPLVRWRT